MTERIDLKDPADLRPTTTAFWLESMGQKKRGFCIIASEEHALQRMIALLDKEGLIDGAAPDYLQVSPGMVSRYHFDDRGEVTTFGFFDRYGCAIELDDPDGWIVSVYDKVVLWLWGGSNQKNVLVEIDGKTPTDRYQMNL